MNFVIRQLSWNLSRHLGLKVYMRSWSFVFDVRCLGEKKDKIASTNTRTLFKHLKTVYQSFGDKLQHVVVDMEKKQHFGTVFRTSELKRSTGTH